MTDINYPTITNAVSSLVPNHSGFTTKDEKIIAWNTADEKSGVVQPTQAEIDTELIRLQGEYDALQYQRDRAVSFPTWQEQMDMQYHDQLDGTTTWKDAIAKVKADNPKPEPEPEPEPETEPE
jgi:hypothetical protein